MSSSTYQFTIVGGAVIAMYESDDGIWHAESIDSDETASYDGATKAVTITESHGDYLEVQLYQPIAAGSSEYALAAKTYTDLLGNPITSMPTSDDNFNDSNHDGFDDDDMDHDGFEDDSLTGGSGGDDLRGAAGDDTLSGGAGDDRLSGGSGDDNLHGDLGNDSMLGGLGDDNLAGGEGADTISGGNGADDIIGGAGDDSMLGGDGADHLWGGGGNDDVNGGAGADVIEAGDDAGNDHYVGGLGIDTLRFGGADDGVVVSLLNGTAVSAGATDLAGIGSNTITGIEDVVGGSFDDRLIGNSGSNRLDGGRGADSINGGLGSDVITGGYGADLLNGGNDSVRDVFDFNAVAESRVGAGSDKVLNFHSGIDDIDLRTIDADSSVGGNQAFAFGGTTATAHGVWQSVGDTATVLFGDVNGDAVADFAITLVGSHGVVSGDILL